MEVCERCWHVWEEEGAAEGQTTEPLGKFSDAVAYHALTTRSQLKQIADGIKYMHDEGVVHGDLRGVSLTVFLCHRTLTVFPWYFQANIFLKTDHNVVIGDFGLSIYVDAASNAFNSTRSGNERYLAPELSMPTVTDDELKNNTTLYGVPTELISRSNRPSKASDLFSFAMLCVEVCVARSSLFAMVT